jgi:hypothetical protein
MSNSSISSTHETSQLNMSTDNDTKLNLPFETTEDTNVIQTVNYYFTNMLNIEWLPCDTFEQYLTKIKQYENKYFDIRNFSKIALNTLIIKQIQDLKKRLKNISQKLTSSLQINGRSVETYGKWKTHIKSKHSCIINPLMIITKVIDLRLTNTLDI